MPDKRTILITGANGFIGGRIAERLSQDASTIVRAGILSYDPASRLSNLPVDLVVCDVLDRPQVEQCTSGITEIIHCAMGSREVNIQGTRNLLEAASHAGVRHFIHLSTTDVYGNTEGEIDESTSLRNSGIEYPDSKIAAEALCWSYAEKGFPLTVIRPVNVYGPFGIVWSIRFAQRFRTGKFSMHEALTSGLCNMVYVDDLVGAVIQSIGNQKAIGEAFIVNGPELITWGEYFQRFNHALGLPEFPHRSLIMSLFQIWLFHYLRMLNRQFRSNSQQNHNKIPSSRPHQKGRFSLLKEYRLASPMPNELKKYRQKSIYLADKARDILGYKAGYGIDRGLRQTSRWLKEKEGF